MSQCVADDRDIVKMFPLLFDFATDAEYRVAVKREFEGIKALFGEYQEALHRVYDTPRVPDPR